MQHVNILQCETSIILKQYQSLHDTGKPHITWKKSVIIKELGLSIGIVVHIFCIFQLQYIGSVDAIHFWMAVLTDRLTILLLGLVSS